MLILGYLGAVAMGLILGILGGGGSIVAVPILVNLFAQSGAQATYHSLFIVGICAVAGTIPLARRGLVAFRTGFVFLLPSLFGVMIARRIVLPSFPNAFVIAGASLSKDGAILIAFGIVMIAAAVSMLRKKQERTDQSIRPGGAIKTAVTGIAVGLTTGIVGAGGGFLIVPALVNGISLPMAKAVGTSLFIIAVNSLTGFAGDWWHGASVDWPLVGSFSAAALAGVFLGTTLGPKIPAARLKPVFGWFVLVLGSIVILQQIRP